jgi:lipopolysaccharide/colanic/teichoic acid biosynthesis glycosyltransferase
VTGSSAGHIEREERSDTRRHGRSGLAEPAVLYSERSVAARAVKRAVDLLAASALLVITAPLSVIVAALIKLEDGGPVLFRQRRVGRNGVVFTLCKFRSMAVDAEADSGPVWAQRDDPRVTRVGRWMRPLGIDEIPQALNVLRGEMSFVGPRPERPEFIQELEAAIPRYAQRHRVRPGITGWAQINLPYGSTLDAARDKLDCDLYYLRHAGLRLDIRIIVRTLSRAIFSQRAR